MNLKQDYNLKKETLYKWWPLKENFIWKVNNKNNKVAQQTLKIDSRSPEFGFWKSLHRHVSVYLNPGIQKAEAGVCLGI